MEERMLNQNHKKSSIWERYKARVLNKEQKDLEMYKDSSGSWIFLNRIGGMAIDGLGWIFLVVALYIGWQSGKWDLIGCDRISPQLCNSCFQYVSNSFLNISNLGNLSNQVNTIPLVG